jgi:hypothetical protein
MEADNLEAGWREVALMLNGANEILTEKVYQLNQEYARLQEKHRKIQDLTLIVNKGLSRDN